MQGQLVQLTSRLTPAKRHTSLTFQTNSCRMEQKQSKEEPEVKKRQERPVPLPSPEPRVERSRYFTGSGRADPLFPFSRTLGEEGSSYQVLNAVKDEKSGLSHFGDPTYEDPFNTSCF